ncbi:hypothetical protein D3C77_475440 [compost metagenome]
MQTIDLIVLYLEAARVNVAGIRAGVATLVDVKPRGLLDHVQELGEVLVFHALAGHDTDCLRRLADRQGKLGCGSGGTAGVGAGALGGGTETNTVDAGGAKLKGICARLADDQCVSALLVTQAAAGQQSRQGVMRLQLAADRRSLTTLHQRTVDCDGQPCGFAQLTKRGSQRLCWQVEIDRRGQHLGGQRHGHCGREGAQGRLHQHAEFPSCVWLL